MIRPAKLLAPIGAGALLVLLSGVVSPVAIAGAASAPTSTTAAASSAPSLAASAPTSRGAARTAGPHVMPMTTPGINNRSAPAGAHLTYFGGPVISSAKVQGVFWGPGTYGSQAGPGGSMPAFYNAVGGSPYFDWLKEYNTTVSGGTNQTIGHASSLGEATITPSGVNNGSTIDDVNMKAELAAQLNAGHLPAPTFDAQGAVNTLYALYFPDGKTLTEGGSTGGVAGGFCAYHSTLLYQGHDVPYMVLPAFTPTSGYAHGCGSDPTLFNDFTSVSSHELVEAVTDAAVGLATVFGPPLGWYDGGTGGEIGDLCNAQQGSIAGFVVQKQFSNAAADCIVSRDFSIGASPASATLLQGGSTTSTISTAVTSGVTGTVGLAVSGVPAGATASLSPTSVTAGGSSTLTIHAGTATPGPYTLTVTGTEVGAVHSTTFGLTVTSPVSNDFSIGASPASVSLAQGTQGTSTISTTVASGVAGTVALAVSGVPAGATASVSPVSVTAGASSTLTVNAGTATPGSYTITVTGTEGAATHATSVGLTVAGAPSAPVSPVAVAGPGQATVSWTAPTSTGNWPLLSYRVTAVPGGQTCTAAAPVTSCLVTGLDPFASYTFGVTATNGNPITSAPGLTGPAASTSPAVNPAATAPAILTVVPGNASATVTWGASLPTPLSYTVSSTQGHLVGPTCVASATTCVVTGLTNGKPYAFVVTATYASGTTASAASAAATPKIFADLAASNSAPTTIARSGAPLTVVEGVTNNGPQAATGNLLITVASATESGIAPAPGLTCGVVVTNLAGTGFTQQCTTVAPLAPGATLSVTLTLHPLPLPPVTSSIKVTAKVSLPVTVPATYSDPVGTNNTVTRVVKVIDTADLAASFTSGPSVGRSATALVIGTISNLGTDPVYAKFTVVVANASEAGIAPGLGLTCGAAVPNGAGTGFSQACTTSGPLAPGTSISVQLTLSPNASPSIHGLTVTGTVTSVGGTVVDANHVNNKAVLPVAITDSANLSAALTSSSSSVARAASVGFSGTIANAGPDAVIAKVTITLAGGTIVSGTADAGLVCVGTGLQRTCTLTAAIAAGATLGYAIVVAPSASLSVVALTATSTVSVLGGVNVTDPGALNNVATSTVAIT